MLRPMADLTPLRLSALAVAALTAAHAAPTVSRLTPRSKALGIVTTADVFDATPAGNAVHTSHRGAGTGIVDQFFDDRGRKWFLPAGTPGSARADTSDYGFSATDAHTADLVRRWGAAPGVLDQDRDLIQAFQSAGFHYAAPRTELDAASGAGRLLGLFALSDMNVALDKIDGRRGTKRGTGGSVVEDYGFPDQPMLEEMTQRALDVLKKQPKGLVLMVEGASIDHRLLVGYGANADRYEDWHTHATPQRDPQQPFVKAEPLKWYPASPVERDDALGEYLVTGRVPGESAVHTATDVPLSAYGPGALAFTGVIDNTDVFFKLAQAVVKGPTAPADAGGSGRPKKR
jgi:alkaline phosphatase